MTRLLRIVTRLYRKHAVRIAYLGVLGREPDSAGAIEYERVLSGSGRMSEVLRNLATSQEHWEKLVGARARELVRSVFHALLYREPDEKAAQSYSGALAHDPDLRRFIAEVAESREHWERLVERRADALVVQLIQKIHQREPTSEELKELRARLIQHHDIPDIASQIAKLARTPVNQPLPPNTEIVIGLYRGLLGRDPSIQELALDSDGLIDRHSARDFISRLTQKRYTAAASERSIRKDHQDIVVKNPSVGETINTPRSITLGDGFHHSESAYAWSSAESHLTATGKMRLYLSCNYLAPGETRTIKITFPERLVSVTLDNYFVSHEIETLENGPQVIKFSADGALTPFDAGIGADTRSLAFQVWFRPPDNALIAAPILPAVNHPTIVAVSGAKKEADSLKPVLDRLAREGLVVKTMSLEQTIAYCRETRVSNAVYLFSMSSVFTALANSGCRGRFIYIDHGTAPLKRYSYREHFAFYDLALVTGDLLRNRLASLYPTTAATCRTVGYPKLKPIKAITPIEREIRCKALGLDPKEKIVLFAPTWSGGDKERGIFNMKYLSNTGGLFAIPHDGDYGYAQQLRDRGYRVHLPTNDESISDYYDLPDVLVTDVSSTAVEFAALGKPVICMAIDHIPDYDARFRESLTRIGIPHTNEYWDFCEVVERKDIDQSLAQLLQFELTSTESARWASSVKSMIACYGDEAADRSADAILEFLQSSSSNVS